MGVEEKGKVVFGNMICNWRKIIGLGLCLNLN